MILADSIDWNGFLEVGVPLYIAAIGSAVAAVKSADTNRKVTTSNGHTIGQLVESAHALTSEGVEVVKQISTTQDDNYLEQKEAHDV